MADQRKRVAGERKQSRQAGGGHADRASSLLTLLPLFSGVGGLSIITAYGVMIASLSYEGYYGTFGIPARVAGIDSLESLQRALSVSGQITLMLAGFFLAMHGGMLVAEEAVTLTFRIRSGIRRAIGMGHGALMAVLILVTFHQTAKAALEFPFGLALAGALIGGLIGPAGSGGLRGLFVAPPLDPFWPLPLAYLLALFSYVPLLQFDHHSARAEAVLYDRPARETAGLFDVDVLEEPVLIQPLTAEDPLGLCAVNGTAVLIARSDSNEIVVVRPTYLEEDEKGSVVVLPRELYTVVTVDSDIQRVRVSVCGVLAQR